MSHVCVSQPAPYLHGRPTQIRRKRQSFDFQALTSRNKANHGHRLSQQLPVPSDQFKEPFISTAKTSIDLDVKVNDAHDGAGGATEKGNVKVSKHKATRSMEADDITGFWSRRLSAQKRTLAVKQPPSPAPNLQSFRVRTFSSTAMQPSTQSPQPQSNSSLKALAIPISSSTTTSTMMQRTLKRKPTMGPPPPPKDRHALRTHASSSKVNTRPATSPQVTTPRKSKSAPLQSYSSASTLLPSQSGSLRSGSSSKGTLPFPSMQNESGRDEKGRSAKLFPPITFSKIVSSMTRRSPSVPTTPVTLPIIPSGPGADQERSASDMLQKQQSTEKTTQEKVDRDRRRKTGLEQIVVDAGRDKHTYTKESETEEVLRILEQLRKLKAA